MDTQDRFMPRDTEADSSVNRDAEFNPDAVVDDPGGHDVVAEAFEDGGDEVESAPFLKPWQIMGLVAGGLAIAAGIGGLAYWRLTQSQRVQTYSKRIDLSKAHPRRLSQMAGRRIERLPVREMQKRIAYRVSHLFD